MKNVAVLIVLFVVCMSAIGAAAYLFLRGEEPTETVDVGSGVTPETVDAPLPQGCIAHPDGKFERRCSLQIACDNGKSTCILDDGTVCIEACDPCVRLVDGKWKNVNGWVDPEGAPVTVTPSRPQPMSDAEVIRKAASELKRLKKLEKSLVAP